MVKVITEKLQDVNISNCNFHAPHKIHELFWDFRDNIRGSRKKQSCIDFALIFCNEEDDEMDDRYLISLDYDELQNFIDWWRLCIYTYKPISVEIGRKVFHEVEHDNEDEEDEDADWNNLGIFDNVEIELQKRRITYYPLNKDEWYLEMQKIPVNLVKEHYKIQKDTRLHTYKKAFVKKQQMITWIFTNMFFNILCNLRESYYNPGRYQYLFDTIKDELWFSQEETMNYIQSIDERTLNSIIFNKSLWNLLLHGREPPLVKKVVKEKFLKNGISYGKYLKMIKTFWYIQKYPKDYEIWLLSSELFNYLWWLWIRHPETHRIRRDEIYFSPVETKNWLIKCFLWYQKKEPIMFYINNVTDDFSKIRDRLESMLPPDGLLLKSHTLKLGWGSPTIPRLEIKYVLDKKHDWILATSEWEFEWIIKYLKVKYTYLGETREFKINTTNRTVIDIVEHFYRPLMEFITSENFIDYNKILKVKYYDKSLEYKSIINSFKSDIIEWSVSIWTETYYQQLRARKQSKMNKAYNITESKINKETGEPELVE